MGKIVQLLNGVFADRAFYQKMLLIAIPVTMQTFITALLNMVDTIMVGKLGETEIAAVGIANQYFFFFVMILTGLSAGCSVFIAQFWGKRDLRNIKRILGIGLSSAVLFSLLFVILGFLFSKEIIALFNTDPLVTALGAEYLRVVLISYLFTAITFIYCSALRSVEKAISPMVISACALLINIFFNYMLIFGKFGAPALGVKGAAFATVIARAVELVLLVVVIYSRNKELTASINELLDFTFAYVKKAYRIILPVILDDLIYGLGCVAYVAVYGRMGTQSVAATQICNTINELFLIVAFGLSGAAAVMVGNSIGAGEEQLSKNYTQRFSLLAVMTGMGIGLLLAVVSPVILGYFNISGTVRHAAQIILYIMSATFFIRVLVIMFIVGILRGGGDAKQAFFIETFTMWVIGVPLTILGAFVFHLPVYFVYAFSVVEEICKMFLCFIRLKTGKWLKNVTHHLTRDHCQSGKYII